MIQSISPHELRIYIDFDLGPEAVLHFPFDKRFEPKPFSEVTNRFV